jgi:hypothetical protein
MSQHPIMPPQALILKLQIADLNAPLLVSSLQDSHEHTPRHLHLLQALLQRLNTLGQQLLTHADCRRFAKARQQLQLEHLVVARHARLIRIFVIVAQIMQNRPPPHYTNSIFRADDFYNPLKFFLHDFFIFCCPNFAYAENAAP